MVSVNVFNNRHRIIIIVVVLCVLLCVTLAASFMVSADITAELRDNSYDSLMDASEIIRQNMDSAMQADIDLVSSFGALLEDTDYLRLQRQLTELCLVDDMYRAMYVDSSGAGIDQNGTVFTVDELLVPDTALSGRASISVGFTGDTGQQHMLAQAPIFSGEEIVGALYGEVVATRYYSQEVFVFFNGQARASLFDRNTGSFVIKAPQTGLTDLKTDNLFSALLQANNSDVLYETFRDKVSAGEKSIFNMEYAGMSSFIAVLPCKTNNDLYVATIISAADLQVDADSIGNLILLMQGILIVGLCGLIVLGALLLIRMMKYEQERQAREQEEKAREKLTAALVKAQEASIAKTQFLSNMSHDIRTPMNAIIGMAALAAQSVGDEEKLHYCLSTISSSSRHLLDLINDILDMSKIESGNLTIENQPFALPVAINSVKTIIAPLCRSRQQQFIVDMSAIRHEFVVGDKTKFSQVLVNLLNNANKFTPDGGKVELIAEELPTESADFAAYRLAVRDTGIGIDPAEQSSIFDAFYRANGASTGKVEGTGLGLSIAKSIVEAMGGNLELESALGQGTTFTMELRFPLQKQAVVAGEHHQLQGKRVLVVAAEPVLSADACTYLAQIGAIAEHAGSAEQAMDIVRQARQEEKEYNIVLADEDMEQGGGREFIRRLRQEYSSGLLILALTASGQPQAEEEAYQAGANGVLVKPLFRSCLYEKLTELLRDSTLYKDAALSLEGVRVLLVEDHLINQTVAKRLLESVGAQVEVANNGQEGVDMFNAAAEGYYDAILMDIQMPVMNGYEAARAIRRGDRPDGAGIPIVALTANAFAADSELAEAAAMNAHLTKPIEPQVMIETLHSLTLGRKLL